MKISVIRLDSRAQLPVRSHPDDAGMDLYSVEEVVFEALEQKKIKTGIALEFPNQCVGLILDRSSMALQGVHCLGGVIDSGYRGEIQVILKNLSNQSIVLKEKSKIAQIVILPVLLPVPEWSYGSVSETERGSQGFGSSGA